MPCMLVISIFFDARVVVFTLIGVAGAHADVAHVASLHDVVERLHRLLDRCIIVEPMALKNVNVVELQTLQAVLDALKDMLAAPGGMSAPKTSAA